MNENGNLLTKVLCAAAFLAMIFEVDVLVNMMSIGTLQAYTIVALCVMMLR